MNIPQELKKMFGLKDAKDVNMANNIWKMLDEMAENDPQQYKKFVEKNVKEGMDDARKKEQQKEKPYRVKPKTGFCLTMAATLSQQPFEPDLNQKILVTKQPWNIVKANFPNSIKLTFNITHCDRIRQLKSRSTQKVIEKFMVKDLKDIELFYYSFHGPTAASKNATDFDCCMILNSKFYDDLMSQNGGKKIIMGLCISYLQQRLQTDRNPLLKQYNPNEFKKIAFYSIDKYSIQVSQKSFRYGESNEPIQFLLQKEVDKKRQAEQKKQEQKKQAQIKPKKPQIIFKQVKTQEPVLPQIKLSPEPAPNKKVLIEVLKEEENEENNEIAHTIKETQQGYSFQFLLPGVNSIKQVDLQMKADCVLLKTKGKNDLLINLKKPINEQSIKAKFKKAESMLRVQAKFK